MNTPNRLSISTDSLKLSRRQLLVLGASAVIAVATPRRARAVPSFRAYHDVSSYWHSVYVEELTAAGFRPLSVSIYGTPHSPAFAAVWLQQSEPAWRMASQVDAAGFQAFFEACAQDNFRIVLLSATGPGWDPRFIAVAEESTIGIPLTQHLLGSGPDNQDWTIQYWLKWARKHNQIPRALAIYGTDDDPRYAVAFEPNTGNVLWNADGLHETAAEYRARYDAQWQNDGRPAQVHVSSAGRYLSLFRGDHIVNGLVAQHNMTSAEYQTEFDHWAAQGLYPIFVSGGGSDASARFSALFAETEAIEPRRLTRQGPNRSARVDDVMTTIMRDHQVRHATLAVINGRKLIFARAYTFAEAGYPVATPTTYFRVASCVKTLTAILMLRLIQEGKLTLGTKLQSVLNLKTPSGDPPKDPRFGDITVRHLLTHWSGLYSWYPPWDVAPAFNVSYPVSKSQTASFAASIDLAFAPGSKFSYSNMGYVLLGMIAEKKLGVSYLTALRNKVFSPLGTSRVRRFPLLPESQPTSEAKYDSTVLAVGSSVVTGDGQVVPLVYGADFDSRVWDASGGLSVAAPDFAKVLASLNVRSNNPVLDATRIDLLLNNSFGFDGVQGSPRQTWKGGAITGLSSTLNFVEQGISYVVCFGKNEVGGDFYPDFPALRSAVAATSWPSQDLFPSFRIPSF